MFKNLFKKVSPESSSLKHFTPEFYEAFDLSYNNSPCPKAGFSSYSKNVIVHRCINLIAQSASHIPWVVYHKGSKQKVKVDSHPVHFLLNNPCRGKGGAEFFEQVISNKLLFGNSYILAVGSEKAGVKELHVLNPNNVSCVIEKNELAAYKYIVNSLARIYPVNKLSGESNILHLKNYNPFNDFYGLSSLEAASLAIELHNKASEWNYSLLKNGARPSGALFVKDNQAFMSEEQFQRLKEQLYENYKGAANSGKPMLLEGGLDWRDMSISPRDMDFVESKNSAAREIALSFGVPPQLLGIAGDNTYSNMQEARLALWEETLLPLLDNLADSLTNFLSPKFKEEIIISFDKDAISALAERRQNIWAKLEQASFITEDEKRAFIGLPPLNKKPLSE
jgi:HK97 family phage portal protein